MAWPPILVRYGEIGIKSRQVRSQFERRLMERIEEQLVRRGVEAEVRRDWGRMFVRASDTERALDALRHTFGVVSVSPAQECAATPDAVAETVLEVAREHMKQGMSFAVRVKRSGSHTFTSLDVAKACASRILSELEHLEPSVDLDHPDFELRAEVRDGPAFVFTRVVDGPGGLPMGSQGKVALLVDSPRAAHAAWLVAKRGSAIDFFAFDVPRAEAWLKPLYPWMGDVRIRSVDADDRPSLFPGFATVLRSRKCQAIVVADDATEALARHAEDATLGFPVFRPLVGYPGERFRALAGEAELPGDV